MDEYLKETLEKLKANDYSELNLVIGNESCDLDSAVCAVVYSTFLYWQYDKIKCCKVCTRFNRDEVAYKDSIFVPMLNVDRDDYDLKTEVAYCLRESGISDQNLLFRNDFDVNNLLQKTPTKVILVDHHVLSASSLFLTPYVTEIIDHRPIDKSHWEFKDDTRSTIEVVGSCSTLVANRIKDLSTLVAKQKEFFEYYKSCCDLLHSTIILDTVNFSKEFNKGTPRDMEIVILLESVLKINNPEVERKSKLDRLVAVKSDVSSLTASQLLRKDLKILSDVLVPSFPILAKEFLQRPGALKAISETLTQRGCSIAVLLGMDLSRGLSRDMAVWCLDEKKAEQLSQFLEGWTPSFDLLSDKLANISDKLGTCNYYVQRNLSPTRKQYMPAIARFLKDVEK